MNKPYQLFHHATEAIRADAGIMERAIDPPTPTCAYCNREWSAVENPGVALAYRYDTGLAYEYLCTTCYTPRIGAHRMLGIDSYRGNKKTPCYGKLGMLNSSGAVITGDGILHLALRIKPYERFKEGWMGRNGQLHQCSSEQLLIQLEQRGRLHEEQGFLYIQQFGNKADNFMAGLALTRAKTEVWSNSDQDARVFDLHAAHTLAEIIRAHDLTTKAKRATFWRDIKQWAQSGRYTDRLVKWEQETPGADMILAALPADPADCAGIDKRVQAIIEAQG